MTKQEFLAMIEEILETSPASLKGNEALDQLEGWDSLAVVSFIAMVDEHLDMTVSPEHIFGAKTVNDLVALAHTKLTGE